MFPTPEPPIILAVVSVDNQGLHFGSGNALVYIAVKTFPFEQVHSDYGEYEHYEEEDYH